ncbi:MAG TPA: YjiH family protein, partial [Chondromyces sp.]|nr:YjiH family protein [Chondromyces sp.]
MDTQHKHQEEIATKSMFRFLVPSLLGAFLFMIPIPLEDGLTIPIAILSNWLQEMIGEQIPTIMTYLIVAAALGTVAMKAGILNFLKSSPFWTTLLDISPFWAVTRVLGAIFAIMTLYKLGPEAVYSDATGGTLLFSLLPVLFATFLFAGLFLPLLLNFGLLEFFGYALTKVMRPLFKLPGRSSVDCLASWLGDGTIGVLLTSKQYEQGYYTKKEASIIGTAFSVVSITFCLVVISQAGLEDYFIPFYITVIIAGILAAIITPRIPPLSRKEETYYNNKAKDADDERIPEGYTAFSYGYKQALVQAQKSKIPNILSDGIRNVLDMWL